MESKVKAFGHPVHPILIVFPLGLLATSLIFDIIHWITGNGFFSVSRLLDDCGRCDWWTARRHLWLDRLACRSFWNTRQSGWSVARWRQRRRRCPLILSWLIRLNAQANPPIIAYILSVVAVILALVAGWLGGELVDRLGVGVDEGANLNAPSPLSGHTATETAYHT